MDVVAWFVECGVLQVAAAGATDAPWMPCRSSACSTGMQRIQVASNAVAVAMLAPGHTPGQMHVIIPVRHQGQERKLFVWSGNDQPDQADQYALSTDFVAGVAFKEGHVHQHARR
jgi:hypothetical protein